MRNAVGFISAQLARADLMPRLLVERRVHRDEIGFAQQLVERHVGQSGFALLASGLRRGVQ